MSGGAPRGAHAVVQSCLCSGPARSAWPACVVAQRWSRVAEWQACRLPRQKDSCWVSSSGWQIVIALCLLIVTAVGLARLVGRGPTRMTNGVFITGFLIVAITVIGSFAVSCWPDDDRHAVRKTDNHSICG